MLKHSSYLEYLNVTNTRADQSLQEVLPTLSRLNKLFIWQTGIQAETLENWKKQFPKVKIYAGADVSDDAPMVLRPPKLKYGRSFFDDTAHVELEFPFKGVEIYYTLDEAASPTTQSNRYQGTIVLDQTSHVRAFAAKAGWTQSSLVDAVFVKKKMVVKSASLTAPPSPKYPAKGAPSLIDGKIADAQGADTWLGYEGEHLTATLDLGEVKSISKTFAHCLENNGSWIHRPIGMVVSTSLDGKKYTQQGVASFAPNTSMGEQKVHLLGCHFKHPAEARFVKIKVENMLKNPSWHPGKGLKSWIFVDELVVE
ncbi:MAG: chitobiase/beta-hexosaminidase C-terminal domain-containing protein [Saprospiraceae bacterium]|nr:chitobiase/beta-hexosaminidase C-terminal domain-containing protein [Saprospiraceae bacterium]